uniref:Probable DNA polymerase n=1 Tax=Blumeria hordei TaxID=2867405 RepID=Q85H34_BLUHO|nr:DNA polymerase [Blumeria hordei]
MIYNFSHSHHSRAPWYFLLLYFYDCYLGLLSGKGFYNFPIYFYSSCASGGGPTAGTLNKKNNRKTLIRFYPLCLIMDLESFRKELFYSGKLTAGQLYSVLFKVRKGDLYLMLGKKQDKILFTSIDDEYFEVLFEEILDRFVILFFNYANELEYTWWYCYWSFSLLLCKDDIKITNLKEAKLLSKDELVVKREFSFYGNSLIFTNGMPISMNILSENSDFAKLVISGLEDKPDMARFSEKFWQEFKSGILNYHFDGNSKIFIIKHLNKHYIIIMDQISNCEYTKRCFNRFGSLISQVKDILLQDGCLKREAGNFTTIFSNNEIISSERKLILIPIVNDYKMKWSAIPNTNIGVLDLETYEDDSMSYCYSIGFYSAVDESCNTFYISKDLNSTMLIHNWINEMLRPKYKDITFYVHNLGRFDAPFIIKALTLFNLTEEGIKNPYNFEAINRNSDILKLTIKRKIGNKVRVVKISDSYTILPRSLRDLCKDFNVEIAKSYFPYLFCTKDTLFYKGKTPDISYYVNITNDDYQILYREVWDLEKECISYLEKDLMSLYQVLVKVNKTIHFLFDIQMTECLTISGIAMRIFLTKYYKKEQIPLITNKAVFDDIHSAYYGGRVEVYNPVIAPGEVKYYYDGNSLYPYASLNPIPGVKCTFIESIKPEGLDSANLFGFFYCKIKSSGNYLGLLPTRTKTNLIFPVGEWFGWYFSEELKFAKDNGYVIEVIKGYNFNKVPGVFQNFVDKIYEIKSNPKNPTEKNVSKLILNSLIGRFGMDFNKVITSLVNKETHNTISITRLMTNSIEIGDNTYLDSYKPSIDKVVCNKFGVDFNKALNSVSFDVNSKCRTHKSVSISTAAAILSYARIHMSKIKTIYLKKRRNSLLYWHRQYSYLYNNYLRNLYILKEIGKLKLEHIITEGYFISDKTYAFKTNEGKLIKKAKGVKSSYLSYEDYIKMHNMEILEGSVKTSSYKDYSKGCVLIKDEKVNLNPTSYNKRKRIFVKDKWVATSPIVVGSNNSYNLDKSITGCQWRLVIPKENYALPRVFQNPNLGKLFNYLYRKVCINCLQ